MWLKDRWMFGTLALIAILSAGCTPPISSKGYVRYASSDACSKVVSLRLQGTPVGSKEDAESIRTGALNVGNGMLLELCSELAASHDTNLAAVITEGARAEMNAAVGSLIIVTDDDTIALKQDSSVQTRLTAASKPAAQIVTGPIVRGAFLSLIHPKAALDETSQRTLLAKDIVSGTTAALKEGSVGMSTAETLDTMSEIANAAVKTLPEAKLAGDVAKDSVAAVTMTAVGSLPRAGIETENLGAGAEKLAEGAVSALNAPGFNPESLGSLTGEVTGSAIQGLSTAGLSAEKIIEGGAIESIISGATSGLKKTDTSASNAVQVLGSIAGSAVSVLSKVGLTSPELQKDALAAVVKSSMSGAQSLSDNNGETLANAMSAVASQAVLALTSGGFESSQIGGAISTIVQTGVSEISKNGISSASSATNIASKLIEGALAGAGTLIQSGNLATDQVTEVAQAASKGAVEGLQSLQTAGIVTGDAVSVFTTSIVSSVSSGLEQSGTDATIIAQAQTGATTVVESEEVKAQIEASAGTAEAVATPAFSVAAGSYASALSVSITTTTSGASIRYTLDGSIPSSTNGTLYSAALAITSTKTLKAIAYKTGWSNSEVATISYTVNIPSFSTPKTYATGVNPEGLAAGDLNGDGIMDLAIGLYNGKGVSFLLGNGNGTFGTKQDVSNSPNSAGSFASILSASIAVDDINADGKADAVWGAWGDNFMSVLTNTTTTNATTLTFANNKPTGYNPGISGPRGVGIADFDADGLKDVVIGEANGNKLVIYLNQSGSVGNFVKYSTTWLWNPDSTVYNGNAHPWMVAIADFNTDGKPDVVGGGGFGGIFSVMLNTTTAAGTPAFQTANRINTATALSCSNNRTVSVSDFNSDDKPDVVASCPTAGTDRIAIFLNSTAANATAASFTLTSLDAGEGLAAVTSGDINGDGKADIVAIANSSPNALYVFRGNGDGTFASAETFSIGTGTSPGQVLLVDVNADNRPDIVVTNGSTNQVTVFLNQTP
jgi:hypothetical protein